MSAQTNGEKRSAIAMLQEFSIPLIAGVIAAIIWANTDLHEYHHAMHDWPFGHGSKANIHFFANEILMVFFFGIAAKEITEACLPGGALNPPSKAINPLMGTLGGVIGPVGMFFVVVAVTGDQSIANGWGIPTATDIALAWLVARLVFGAKHPAVSFLLLLAVADDAIGLGIIAVFYPDPTHPVRPVFLVLVGMAMAIGYLLKRKNVQSFWPYVVIAGSVSWAGFYLAHLHPALALVAVVPFMPNAGSDEGIFTEGESERHHDTLNQFEHFFKTPVDFGLFLFGLANAGVAFSSMGNATWAVLIALIVGKTVGITAFSMGAHLAGFRLPQGMNLRSLIVAGVVAGLGLTVALFVAGVAYTDPGLMGAAKMGALFSAAAAPIAMVLGKVLGVRRKDELEAGEKDMPRNPSGRPSFRPPGPEAADLDELEDDSG